MEYFCHHRDRAGSLALRQELREKHRPYTDQQAKQLIARGLPFTDDGETLTGSVRIVDRPDPAVRTFAFDEPNHRAGTYRDVLLRRWHNQPGRTMWDFPGGRSGGNRYLVLGLGEGPAADLTPPPDRNEPTAHGPLLSDDGDTWIGTAALLRTSNPDTARAILTRTVRGHRGPHLGVRRAPMNPESTGPMPSPNHIDPAQERQQ